MKLKTKLFIDLDGVLCDLVEGICKYYNVKNPYDSEKYNNNYNYCEVFNKPNLFNELDYNFWINLEKTKEFNNIIEISLNYDSYILSKAVNSECIKGKYDWISKHLPHMIDKSVLTAAKDACSNNDSVLLDDCNENIENFVIKGKGYLVPRKWNAKHALTETNWIEDFKEYLDGSVTIK